jgi:hypothetical protein
MKVLLSEADYDIPVGIRFNGLKGEREIFFLGDLRIQLTTGTSRYGEQHVDVKRWVSDVIRRLRPKGGCFHADITVVLTNHKKQLNAPSSALGPFEVNTGYGQACTQIVIFRKEDWQKVFIHECFHLFGLDELAVGSVNDLFPIPTQIDLMEVFSETCARILYCRWTRGNLEKEVDFSCLQMVKVLNHFGLRFQDVALRKRMKRFKETSNVFAYYVVTAILMNDATRFMSVAKKLFEGSPANLHACIAAAVDKMTGSERLIRAEAAFSATPSKSLKMMGGEFLRRYKWNRTSTVTGSSSMKPRWRRLKSRASSRPDSCTSRRKRRE